MKYGFLGLGFILAGMFGLVFIVMFESITINNETEYFVLKEALEASMVESVDLACFRNSNPSFEGACNGSLKISEQKLVENFTRRFYESINGDAAGYQIDFYDIIESPPKATVVVTGVTGNYTLVSGSDKVSTDATTATQDYSFDLVNNLSGILEANKWEVNNVYVKFFSNGALVFEKNGIGLVKLNIDNEDALKSGNLQNVGYKFDGWYTAESGGTRVTGGNMNITESVTYYAHWRKIVSINFNGNGGQFSDGKPTYSIPNEDKTEMTIELRYIPLPTKDGFQFNGWYTIDGEKVSDKQTVSGQDVTYYAYWDKPITVIFDPNGGSFSDGKERRYNGSNKLTVNISGVGTPSRAGFVFDGWNTKANGTGVTITTDSIDATNNVTYYAKWKASTYQISLDSKGAKTAGTTAIYEKYGSGWYSDAGGITSITSITKPTKDGYTFGGYYTQENGNGTPVIDANGTIVGGNNLFNAKSTLYAKWTVNTLRIKFNANGGTWNNKSGALASNPTFGGLDSSGYVLAKNGSVFVSSINYGSIYGADTGGLFNYNNDKTINLEKAGVDAKPDAQWCGKSGCLSQSRTDLTAQDIAAADGCVLANNSCEITLKVNWQSPVLVVRYSGNGGTWNALGTSPYAYDTDEKLVYNRTTKSYNLGVYSYDGIVDPGNNNGLLDYNNSKFISFVKNGYVAKRGAHWCLNSNGSGTCYSQKNNSKISARQMAEDKGCDVNKNCFVKLYVNWVK